MLAVQKKLECVVSVAAWLFFRNWLLFLIVLFILNGNVILNGVLGRLQCGMMSGAKLVLPLAYVRFDMHGCSADHRGPRGQQEVLPGLARPVCGRDVLRW